MEDFDEYDGLDTEEHDTYEEYSDDVIPSVVLDDEDGFSSMGDESYEEDDDEDNDVEPDYDDDIDDDDIGDDDIDDDDEELGDWEYPEFIPDDFVAPEEFTSPKAELEWYREKYLDLMDHYRNEEFVERLKESHSRILLGNEEKVTKFKAFDAMASGNPELAIKLYAPEFLAQQGKSVDPTPEEVYDYLDQRLAREFGKNYKAVYDPDDAQDPDTISGKMLARQQALQAHIDEYGAIAKEQVQTIAPVDPQVMLDREYENLAHAMSREEYYEFVDVIREEFSENPINMKDLYLLYHLDDIAEEIYQNGVQDGIKNIGRTMKTYGRQQAYVDNDDIEDDTFDHNLNVYNQLRT